MGKPNQRNSVLEARKEKKGIFRKQQKHGRKKMAGGAPDAYCLLHTEIFAPFALVLYVQTYVKGIVLVFGSQPHHGAAA